jgi:hypothetical protein
MNKNKDTIKPIFIEKEPWERLDAYPRPTKLQGNIKGGYEMEEITEIEVKGMCDKVSNGGDLGEEEGKKLSDAVNRCYERIEKAMTQPPEVDVDGAEPCYICGQPTADHCVVCESSSVCFSTCKQCYLEHDCYLINAMTWINGELWRRQRVRRDSTVELV